MKTGSGKLVLDGASFYNGNIELQGGSLAFERRAVPALESLPKDMLGRFDMSDASSYDVDESDGSSLVCWRNLATGAYAKFQETYDITLEPPDAAHRPFVRKDALGAGLSVLDFGELSESGAYLSIRANGANQKLPVLTVIAAYGIQDWNGSILDDRFARQDGGGRAYRYRTASGYGSIVTPTAVHGSSSDFTLLTRPNGVLYLNGVRTDVAADNFDFPGYITYAHTAPISSTLNVSAVGKSAALSGGKTLSGGLRLMELILYRRVLTEREILDVQAYLSRKWYGRATPGYARAADDVEDDIQKIVVTAPSEIVVPEGATVTVGNIDLTAKLVKRGGGTLVVRGGTGLASWIEAAEGRVSCAGRRDPLTASEIASSPSLHLDAADVATMELVENGGRTEVANWYSADYDNMAYVPRFASSKSSERCTVERPQIDPNVTLNGRPVVDFGTLTDSTDLRAPTMNFARGLDSVRSVFMVMQFKDGCGHFLGGSESGDADTAYSDFARQGSGKSSTGWLFFWGDGGTTQASGAAAAQDIYTNGVKVVRSIYPTGGFQLIEVHTTGGAHASALACNQFGRSADANTQNGSVRIAEAVIYERELTERERIATRNYLAAKWFGTTETALPEKPVEDHVIWNLPYDCSAAMPEAVVGRPVLASGSVVNLSNFPADGYQRTWTLLKGDGLPEVAGPVTVLVNGVPSAAERPAKFIVKPDGSLALKFGGNGVLIIVR